VSHPLKIVASGIIQTPPAVSSGLGKKISGSFQARNGGKKILPAHERTLNTRLTAVGMASGYAGMPMRTFFAVKRPLSSRQNCHPWHLGDCFQTSEAAHRIA